MQDRFSSRWGLIAAGLGMAIGTGNVWRFPRVLAANGGGAFLIPWMIFLLIWSVPLLIAEFHLGRTTRRGPLGAFIAGAGPRAGVLGGFVVVTSMLIFAYYAVVTGWCLGYVVMSLVDWQSVATDSERLWAEAMSGSPTAVWGQGAALIAAALVIRRGVVGGVERANKILVPTLFALLVALAGYALLQPGAGAGLQFMFVPQWSRLLDASTWIEAASQSAWSTGAGWGLLLVYASYAHQRDDAVRTSLLTGLGNNLASIIAGLAVLPTTFARLPRQRALEVLGAGNQGLSFIVLPALFGQLGGGQAVAVVFFITLSAAAFSSLISMMELGVRTLGDLKIGRGPATWIVAAFGFVAGVPSALSMAFFDNQDWVWGLGLLVAGLFVALAIRRHGLARFVDAVAPRRTALVRRWLQGSVALVVPMTFAALFGWWMWKSVAEYDAALWWHPLRRFSVGTCAAQWFVALLIAQGLRRAAMSSDAKAAATREEPIGTTEGD